MTLEDKLRDTRLGKGEIAIVWLGQAGFLLRDRNGHIICIDPYLSDYCERLFGFKRIMPKIVQPGEVLLDILLSTHEHADHFDADSIPLIMSNNPEAILLGAYSSIDIAKKLQLPERQLHAARAGDVFEFGWCKITAVSADHGELSKDAIGFFIELDGVNLYFAGDTCYRDDIASEIRNMRPDIAILPINGAYGNLDASDAINLANRIRPALLIPCHFWMFAMHRGDPQTFLDLANSKLVSACSHRMMSQGEIIRFPSVLSACEKTES